MIASVELQRPPGTSCPSSSRPAPPRSPRRSAWAPPSTTCSARHGARARPRAGAHRLHARAPGARCPACASSARPRPSAAAGLPRSRSRACTPTTSPSWLGRAGVCVRAGPPLRPAADALPGRRLDRARERRRLQRAAQTSTRCRRAAARPRGLRARGSADGRPLPRLHPRALQAPAQLRRARAHDLEALEHNPLCGDELGVQIRVQDGRIADLRFQGHGCAISQASASMASEELNGMASRRSASSTPTGCSSCSGSLSRHAAQVRAAHLKAVRGAVTGDGAWPA